MTGPAELRRSERDFGARGLKRTLCCISDLVLPFVKQDLLQANDPYYHLLCFLKFFINSISSVYSCYSQAVVVGSLVNKSTSFSSCLERMKMNH